MPVFQKGSFGINRGIVYIGGELSEEDRQCGWELDCEMASRVALMGKENDRGELALTGEVYSESQDSLSATPISLDPLTTNPRSPPCYLGKP